MQSDGPNAQQIEYWNEQAGAKWVRLQSFLDAQLRPFGEAAMEGLGSLEGKSILDVGCGCGSTTLELGGRVGADGSVLGVDLSLPMLTQARQGAAEAKPDTAHGQVSFQQADAQGHAFERQFDAVFSRFAVMFFADPVAAFTNLRGALKAGGRLSFICWQPIDRNQWMMVPLLATLEHLPPPEIPAADAPGPFSLADPERVRRILRESKFRDVDVIAHAAKMVVGEGYSLDEITDFVMEVGPTSRLLKDASATLRTAVSDSVRAALAKFQEDGAVRMDAAAWLVSARA